MNAQSIIRDFTDAAADSVGREIARLRAEAKRESELRDAEHRARTAELEARILSAASLERDLREKMSSLKDGEPGKDGRDGTDGIGKDGADGVSLESIDLNQEGPIVELGFVVGEKRSEFSFELPEGPAGPPGPEVPGKDGSDGRDGRDVENIEVTQDGAVVELAFTVGEVRSEFEIELPCGPPGNDGELGAEGPEGKLAAVAAWADEVHYEGAIRTHVGATWQALRDTAKEPPSEDWLCIAARGTDGQDGKSFVIRDTWAASEEYSQFDVVTLNSSSFAARKDNPGECPGPDWKLIAGQGKRGPQGERGARGERGPAGPPVVALAVNGEGLIELTNGDGSIVTCDLYPVLSKLGQL